MNIANTIVFIFSKHFESFIHVSKLASKCLGPSGDVDRSGSLSGELMRQHETRRSNDLRSLIATFCIRHNRGAVVVCVKICTDTITRNRITVKRNLNRIGIVMEKALVKWVLGIEFWRLSRLVYNAYI